jgi:hypothetical protein
MKHRLTVYLDPGLLQQLNELAQHRNQPKSLVAEAAITSFLKPDEPDKREAAFMRRLDRLSRQGERLQRDVTISVEALALFIHYWLTLIPTLPESAQAAAKAKGRERFTSFIETLGRRLANGKNFLRDVSLSVEIEKSAPPASASGPQS